MRVTIDANALFAALIRGGLARRIIFISGAELFAPAFLIDEFQKYRGLKLRKFGGSSKSFSSLEGKIFKYIRIIPDSELVPFLEAAKTLTKDEKDIYYFACALKEGTAIWSSDLGMRAQRRIKTLSTEEMAKACGLLRK